MEQQNTFVFSHLCLVHVKHIKNSYSWISLTKQGGILENFKKLKKTEKEQALKTTFYNLSHLLLRAQVGKLVIFTE
jgi:hypothetical protein